jgi:hypothetical protein
MDIVYLRLKQTRNRVANSLEMIERVDDPAPGKVDFLEIAATLDEVLRLFDLVIAMREGQNNEPAGDN